MEIVQKDMFGTFFKPPIPSLLRYCCPQHIVIGGYRCSEVVFILLAQAHGFKKKNGYHANMWLLEILDDMNTFMNIPIQ